MEYIKKYLLKEPQVHATAFVAPNATVIGDVEIAAGASIWYGSVVRGDVNSIKIGKDSNIQDLTMVHVNNEHAPAPSQIKIGEGVTVGHRVILHGCQIKDFCLIGMGSILMDNVVIESECIIGAGSLVTAGTVIPAGHLAMGSPAKVKRPLTEAEKIFLQESAKHYRNLAQAHKAK